MNADSKPQRSELSVVRPLPTDVLFELFSIAAVLDPPIRMKHQSGGGWTTFPRSADSPRERLGPAWSRLSEGHRKHEKIAKLSTYRLWDSPPTLGWIRLTHVCQQWRTVGVSMAQLWGEVFPVFPLAAETVLARSRGRALSLDMDLVGAIEYLNLKRPQHVTLFFDLARQHISRARVLTFSHFHSHFPHWHIMSFLGLHLPSLEIMRVESAKYTVDTAAPPIQAPALTHMVLGVFIPFTAPSLRFLKITDLANKMQPALLLDVLRSTPLLEELILGSVIRVTGSIITAQSDRRTVHLANLTSARFTGPSLSLTYIGQLRFPLNAELSVALSHESNATGSILMLLDALAPHLCNPSIDYISFTPGSDVEICLASSALTRRGAASEDHSGRVFLKVGHMTTIQNMALRGPLGFLSEVVLRMETANVVLLHAFPFETTGSGRYTKTEEQQLVSQAKNLLRQMPSMATLSLAYMPAGCQPFLSALGLSVPAANTPDTVETLLVHSDDTLVVYDDSAYMGNRRVLVTAEDGVRSRWKDIISALERRANLGQPVKRLVLRGLLTDAAEPGTMQSSMVSLASSFVAELLDERRHL